MSPGSYHCSTPRQSGSESGGRTRLGAVWEPCLCRSAISHRIVATTWCRESVSHGTPLGFQANVQTSTPPRLISYRYRLSKNPAFWAGASPFQPTPIRANCPKTKGADSSVGPLGCHVDCDMPQGPERLRTQSNILPVQRRSADVDTLKVVVVLFAMFPVIPACRRWSKALRPRVNNRKHSLTYIVFLPCL